MKGSLIYGRGFGIILLTNDAKQPYGFFLGCGKHEARQIVIL